MEASKTQSLPRLGECGVSLSSWRSCTRVAGLWDHCWQPHSCPCAHPTITQSTSIILAVSSQSLPPTTPTYAELKSQRTLFPPRLEQGCCHLWKLSFSLQNVNEYVCVCVCVYVCELARMLTHPALRPVPSSEAGGSAHLPATVSPLPALPSGVGPLPFRGRNSLVLTVEGEQKKEIAPGGRCVFTH